MVPVSFLQKIKDESLADSSGLASILPWIFHTLFMWLINCLEFTSCTDRKSSTARKRGRCASRAPAMSMTRTHFPPSLLAPSNSFPARQWHPPASIVAVGGGMVWLSFAAMKQNSKHLGCRLWWWLVWRTDEEGKSRSHRPPFKDLSWNI